MDFREIEGNLYITALDKKELVHFEEINFDNMNCIRIYEGRDPDNYYFQFRAKQSLKGKQKKRNVIATVEFNIEDMEKILEFMKKRVELKA
ncbi:hypothetical protein [Chondrinema litorale]|uniref:hypothetical protein n=1 Tax=Chondrinema litorale TaxID=2994555 RepID=UPI0025436B43|nr:hypothetical protein [Chondrinema litorale]UZR93527.1 hypothetical protein OQ292_16880 [Chondrinema litorale]